MANEDLLGVVNGLLRGLEQPTVYATLADYPGLSAEELDPDVPPCVPQGSELKGVVAEVQLAIREMITPLYRQHVLQTTDGVEKSLGMSLCHLLWMELTEQFDQKRNYLVFEAKLGRKTNRQAQIDLQLRLLGSKVRVGDFFMRLHRYRQEQAAAPSPTASEDGSSSSPRFRAPPRPFGFRHERPEGERPVPIDLFGKRAAAEPPDGPPPVAKPDAQAADGDKDHGKRQTP